MIVIEDAIEGVVEQIPLIDGLQTNFHWGGQDELNRYISLKKQPYPLVWGISQRETHDIDDKFATSRIKLLIATRERQLDRLNNVRLKEAFEKLLFPVKDYLVTGFKKSNRIDFASEDISIIKLPNYSEGGKNKTIDYWDALEFNCSIRVSNNCERTIIF